MPCPGPVVRSAGPTLAEVLRLGLEMAPPSLPAFHWRCLRALLACRTPVLGGHRYQCQDCQRTHFVPHSCRNRHCPLCQGQAARLWLEEQQAALLPVPYFHLVFTLPHELNPLIRQNQRALYKLLFDAASQTLLTFGHRHLQAQLGMTAVLHTWSQTLLDHYHLHCIVTGGGLSDEGSRWVPTPSSFLFPVKALSAMFQGKFCSGLQALYAQGQLQFHGQMVGLRAPGPFQQMIGQATRRSWVVYAKRPFAGPAQVLAYLSRYTHRVAISPSRLLALDLPQKSVTFRWRDYADGARSKTMTLPVQEFMRRFCLHLLPERFVKIRHYGLLGNRQRQSKVARVRALLQTPMRAPGVAGGEAVPVSIKSPPQPVCPYCGSQRFRLVEIVLPLSQAAAPPPWDSS